MLTNGSPCLDTCQLPKVFSHDELKVLIIKEGLGVAPDLIYAQGIPEKFSQDAIPINKKTCTLLIEEVRFCKDLGCSEKIHGKRRPRSMLPSYQHYKLVVVVGGQYTSG